MHHLIQWYWMYPNHFCITVMFVVLILFVWLMARWVVNRIEIIKTAIDNSIANAFSFGQLRLSQPESEPEPGAPPKMNNGDTCLAKVLTNEVFPRKGQRIRVGWLSTTQFGAPYFYQSKNGREFYHARELFFYPETLKHSK